MSDKSPWLIPQRAEAQMRFGRRAKLRASVEVTPIGLLAIGGLMAAILLSSAAIVREAHRDRRRG